MSAVPNDAPLPGLTDPVGDAQRIFRRVLDALAHPGRIVTLDAPARRPAGVLGRAAIGTALALLDFETAIWLDEAAGPVGFGHIAGRDRRHAELAAVFDAMLQHPRWHSLNSALIDRLAQTRAERRQAEQAEIAATRVDFFTLVRGE